MRTIFLWCAALAVTGLVGCSCEPKVFPGDGGAGGQGGGGVGGAGGAGGTGGSGPFDGGSPVDPNDPANPLRDSDCDGLTDAEEFGNVYPGGARTDPANPDTDGDGILDGVEAGKLQSPSVDCGFVGDADPSTKTIPTVADSDADGLSDGLEDANHNGKLETAETSPTSPDTDFDGLDDNEEDVNLNGLVDVGETDPRKKDSDGDFINDGLEVNVVGTNPRKLDTDGDGCSDGAEDFNQNGTVEQGETDPKNGADCGPSNNPDSDNDGLVNSLEDKNANSAVDPGETDPNNPDTDGDGLIDGLEDKNHSGNFQVGETDPLRKDTDCDGLADGQNLPNGVMGEDVDLDGQVSTGETDPTRRDTDADGLTDGIERGVGLANRADTVSCLDVPYDAEPSSTTSPLDPDSDSDGIEDGAEDVNQNGKVDPGELDPNNSQDGQGPAAAACATNNLKPVLFRSESGPDLQLGLPNSFSEVRTMVVNGEDRGLIGYSPSTQVAFVAWKQAAPGASTNPVDDEIAFRVSIGNLGAITNPLSQSFTSWDNVPSLLATYNQAGTATAVAHANALATGLVGPGAGVLTSPGGSNGPFRIQMQILHRTDASVVTILALTPASNLPPAAEPPLFAMTDSAGGSAVAQFGDANAVQCEVFAPTNSKVDFLFVIDDSCSMAGSQGALGSAANTVATALGNSTLDWRIAVVTSTYVKNSGLNSNILRGFTRDIHQFSAWLNKNATACNSGVCANTNPAGACNVAGGSYGGCWVSDSGNGVEPMMQAAAKAVSNLSPGTLVEQTDKMREGANLVVILLGDSREQGITGSNPDYTTQQFISYFSTNNSTLGPYQNRSGGSVVVHGILCPQGKACNGEVQGDATLQGNVISALGGLRGDICFAGALADADCNNVTSVAPSLTAIINSVIGAAGHKLTKPPIGASVKVAMSDVINVANCNKDDLPRSRISGFDFDGVSRSLTFYGDCRPSTQTQSAAVSYRYWIDTTANLNGNPPPCENDPDFDPNDPDFCLGRLVCNRNLNVCECPPDCGGVPPPGKVCDTNRAVCDYVCTQDCGGTCSGYELCNVGACTCECVQNASCAQGYHFENGGGQCGCVCDVASLNCGPTYQPDANACACICQPDCGGCPTGKVCNPSTCSCGSGIN